MANSFSGLTAFVNEQRFANKFWLDSLLKNDALPYLQQYGMVASGVKENTFTLQQLSATVGIETGVGCSDDFDNGNDTTITQRSITLTKGRIKDSICPHDDWETYYTALRMPAGQHYRDLGPWRGPLMGAIAEKVGKRLGYNIWQGEQSGDTWTFSGLYEQLIAANMGTYNAGSNPTGGIVGTGTIDGTNNTTTGAYYVLQNLITAGLTSQSVAGKDFASDVHSGNVHFVLNPYTAELVRQSYLAAHGTAMPEIAIGLAGLQNNVQGGFRFPGWGVPMIIQNFVPNNFVAMIRNGNAVIAFDALSDLTSMEMWQADDHQTLRWLMAFKMGVGWNELTGNAIKYFGATT